MTKKTLVVYLHGFRSSPNSTKAVLTGNAIKALLTDLHAYEWYCPQLLASPKESIAMVENYIDASNAESLVIMGSSLGGFYANYLTEKYQCKGVALNPAVRAARELAPHVGLMTWYDSNLPLDFRSEYVDELKALQVEAITNPTRYFLMAAKGDELLDWKEMAEFYDSAQQLVLEGSDHGISGYADHLPAVIEFIQASIIS
ncbi:YqiA/YcfP family alpha/beta fold hydrolase [Polynucleobacter meluiroseus]|uniref:YqiA/YcfP family alpha/beta fold hydrolase n=1 Tax=Polynucleobacter meluiroseus TaxID=1938814 RepID=UPI000BBC3F2C|nr:YqiA/YcfP family alpha/beta fold hydrolase [Polynucleobacter meluiroseus]